MSKDTMTPRERWLAAIALKPVDRLPFWPKIGGNYQQYQSGKFREMSGQELHELIGSDQHTHVPGVVKEVFTNGVSRETENKDGVMRTVYKTKYGETSLVSHFDDGSKSWHPMEFPVSDLDGIQIMTEFYDNYHFELDTEAVAASKQRKEEIGESAVTATGIGESPLMYWVEFLAGVANAHYLLIDHQADVERLFDSIHKTLLGAAEIIAEHSPADLIYMVENTSTTLISPDQYRQYCFKHIMDYATITSSKGRNMVLHMCGTLKGMLPMLAELPVQAFEAFTSPPVGDTTYLDGRSVCRDKCLIGGTNAALWIRPVDEIIAEIERDLDALPHHRGIVVTSAGVMPPAATPEIIRTVCDWVKAYPQKN